MNYPSKNNNDKKSDGIGGKRLHDVDTRIAHDLLVNANQVRAEFAVNDDRDAFHYTDASLNRNRALRLLNELKSRESDGMAVSKVFWKNGQPTLIESSNQLYWESKLQPFGRPESKGLPATEHCARVPSSWESKLDRRRRANFTLDETPTMAFKASGHLPAHYYQDESALESYVESLTNEK